MLRSTRLSPSIDRNNAENYLPKAEQAHSCILILPTGPDEFLVWLLSLLRSMGCRADAT